MRVDEAKPLSEFVVVVRREYNIMEHRVKLYSLQEGREGYGVGEQKNGP